jgi:CoA:oxalate CoA-transferase
VAVQSALLERERSGEGQYIDISMLDCQVAILENAFTRYFTLGEIPQRIGTRHPSSTPFQAYETADGYVVVAIMGGSTDQWPLFCAAIDHPELMDDERYGTGWARTQHYDELTPIIVEAMRQRTTEEWVGVLTEMGIPVGPVQDIAQVAVDPQVNARGMFVDIDHPSLGPVRFSGNPIKLSRTPTAEPFAPPELGEHTSAVLQGMLGLSAAEVQALVSAGVVS